MNALSVYQLSTDKALGERHNTIAIVYIDDTLISKYGVYGQWQTKIEYTDILVCACEGRPNLCRTTNLVHSPIPETDPTAFGINNLFTTIYIQIFHKP